MSAVSRPFSIPTITRTEIEPKTGSHLAIVTPAPSSPDVVSGAWRAYERTLVDRIEDLEHRNAALYQAVAILVMVILIMFAALVVVR